jgi:nucleotide-binding universal stress UspA family protein
MVRKVLVGTDTSASADLAVGAAADLARACAAPLVELYVKPELDSRAALWAYVLSEAQVTSWAGLPANVDKATKGATPIRLGPVGGRIVAEVSRRCCWATAPRT